MKEAVYLTIRLIFSVSIEFHRMIGRELIELSCWNRTGDTSVEDKKK